jgi:hypothetical protein
MSSVNQSPTANRSTIVGIFEDREDAQRAVADLRRAGFGEDQIGVITPDEGKTTAADQHRRAEHLVEEGATTGALAGASIGGLWAIAIAAHIVPGIGPVIAGGVLASFLASLLGTAAVGGLIGALIGLEIPDEEAHFYSDELSSGRTLLTVKPGERFDEAAAIIGRNNGFDINHPVVAERAAAHRRTRHIHLDKLSSHRDPTGHVGPGATT